MFLQDILWVLLLLGWFWLLSEPLSLQAFSGDDAAAGLLDPQPLDTENNLNVRLEDVVEEFFNYIVQHCQSLAANNLHKSMMSLRIEVTDHHIQQTLIFEYKAPKLLQTQIQIMEHAKYRILSHWNLHLAVARVNSLDGLVDVEIFIQHGVLLDLFVLLWFSFGVILPMFKIVQEWSQLCLKLVSSVYFCAFVVG